MNQKEPHFKVILLFSLGWFGSLWEGLLACPPVAAGLKCAVFFPLGILGIPGRRNWVHIKSTTTATGPVITGGDTRRGISQVSQSNGFWPYFCAMVSQAPLRLSQRRTVLKDYARRPMTISRRVASPWALAHSLALERAEVDISINNITRSAPRSKSDGVTCSEILTHRLARRDLAALSLCKILDQRREPA